MDASISLGLCLPAICSTDHLEFIINDLLRAKSSSLLFTIPKNSCQLEENGSDYRTIDLFAL